MRTSHPSSPFLGRASHPSLKAFTKYKAKEISTSVQYSKHLQPRLESIPVPWLIGVGLPSGTQRFTYYSYPILIHRLLPL